MSSHRVTRCTAALALGLFGLLGGAHRAEAHGINGHVHVTGWAVETLPPGELRDFFADPMLRDTAQIGAGFPDSGYAIDDPYGEMAHWEPFINAYVEWLVRTHGPRYETEEAGRHIAFMMGAASHGLQDEIFDTLFLRYLLQEDGEDQEAADPGTDAFLFTDGLLEFKPPLFVPATGLQEIFRISNGYEPDQSAINGGMARVKILVIDHFDAVAPGYNAMFRPRLPWGSQHYLDPDVPGSLRAEIPATAGYMLALWERLHGRFTPQALTVHTYPTATRRLRSGDHTVVDSRIGLVFGIGAIVRSLNQDTVQLFGPDDRRVAIDVQHTRWSGSPGDSTRQVVLVPLEDLPADTVFEVRLLPGIELMNGALTTDPWSWQFKTPCPAEGACSPGPDAEPLDAPRVPYPPPPDAGLPPDAALVPDAGAPGPPDATTRPPDALLESPDAAPPALADAARPATPADLIEDIDAGPPPPAESGGGGGCQSTPARPSSGLMLLLALPVMLGRRIHRGARPSHPKRRR